MKTHTGTGPYDWVVRCRKRHTPGYVHTLTLEIVPNGDSVFRKSFEVLACIGVSTLAEPNFVEANVSFACSLARLRVTASIPPFVIIGTDPSTASKSESILCDRGQSRSALRAWRCRALRSLRYLRDLRYVVS